MCPEYSNRVILFNKDDFNGTSYSVTTEAATLTDNIDKTSSVLVLGKNQCILYDGENFTVVEQDAKILLPGEYPNPDSLDQPDIKVSSARLLSSPDEAGIILFKEAKYSDATLELQESNADISASELGKQASSAIVLKGKWVLYDGTDYSGEKVEVGPDSNIPERDILSVKKL